MGEAEFGIIASLNAEFSLNIKTTEKNFDIIIDILQNNGWGDCDDCSDPKACSDCDERRGEPIRNEGYD